MLLRFSPFLQRDQTLQPAIVSYCTEYRREYCTEYCTEYCREYRMVLHRVLQRVRSVWRMCHTYPSTHSAESERSYTARTRRLRPTTENLMEQEASIKTHRQTTL